MEKLFEGLKNRLMLMVGRAILAAVNNSGTTQKVQLKLYADEVATDVERVQEYGLETVPPAEDETECVTLAVGGRRDQGVVIAVGNRTYRPSGTAAGDVYLYDKRGNQVRLKDGKIEIEAKGDITIKSTTMEISMGPSGIQLKTGDSATWLPNILPVDPITGMPHGGPGAGIVMLKGG